MFSKVLNLLGKQTIWSVSLLYKSFFIKEHLQGRINGAKNTVVVVILARLRGDLKLPITPLLIIKVNKRLILFSLALPINHHSIDHKIATTSFSQQN